VPLDRDDLLHNVTSNIAQWKSASSTPNNAFISAIAVSHLRSDHKYNKTCIKLKTNLARLVQLVLAPSSAPSLAASYNKILMGAATVVQVLQDLF